MTAAPPPWQMAIQRAPSRALKHPLRARILDAVERRPGIVPQDLSQQLRCNRSTIRYHIMRMQAAGLVRVVSHNQRAHVFPATMAAACQDALAVLQRGRTWDLAREVAQNPGLPQCDLTANLNMSRKILRKYMDRLLEHGLVEEVDEPPFLTYYPTQALQAMMDAWDPQRTKAEPVPLPLAINGKT